MPIKNTKYDRRIKLKPEDKKKIKILYKTGEWSTRKLARKYNVSKRLIQFVLDPAKLEACKARRAERGGSKQYYDKEKWRVTQADHRNYKQKLYLEGKIK